MLEQPAEDFSTSQSSVIIDQCKKILSVVSNRSVVSHDQQSIPIFLRQLLLKQNLTLDSFHSIPECVAAITSILNKTNELNSTLTIDSHISIHKNSNSLITFVVLITCVSFISIIGNLCLAKVLYSKRSRLVQTDRIVLCLALSELCLVLIDSPTEIYRFLSHSFTQEWLCRFHTFFEALFSSCIIFYHVLGAFDRFVYIHGHISSNISTWSKWCHYMSTKSGSIILLLLPLICSFPLAICNCLYANIIHTSFNNKICIVQHAHGLLIALLISFYIFPLLIAFFLHGKLIYFIRTRHNQYYLTTSTYMLPMKRDNIIEFHSKRRTNHENPTLYNRLFLQPKSSAHQRSVLTNTETLGTTTTTTMAMVQSVPLNVNNSSNSSQSSRSSTRTSSGSTTSPIVLYKINAQANANANRTVLLLVLLLSFYVFCWAPYNIYTWYHVYRLTQPTSSNSPSLTSWNDSNLQISTSLINNLNADLRRFIYINYSLYLLSMISMCFSFIFYFALHKQARHKFARFIGFICPWSIQIRKKKARAKPPNRIQYRPRFHPQQSHQNDRRKNSPSSLVNNRSPPRNRTVLNYGCQIQCCA